MSLSENPMFGVMIGQQIGNNASAEAEEIRLTDQRNSANQRANEATGALLDAAQGMLSLRQEVDALAVSDENFYLAIAGVRGVTRELLNELRRADPNNPLLEKKCRDSIFEGSRDAQAVRQNGKDWKQRDQEAVIYRNESFGAENSSKGGPEISLIKPNPEVRKKSGISETHVPDRERFLSLIEKLANELKSAKPSAQILQDREVRNILN